MFNLTTQERQVVLFVASVFFLGVTINALIKTRLPLAKAVRITDDITRINLNAAEEGKLERLPGISPNLAKKITAYRAEHGPFRALEDLKEVKGVGEARYQKLKELFYVE